MNAGFPFSHLAATPASSNRRPMQIHNMTDPRPFAVQIYRTDDALFIHVPPLTLTTAQRIGNDVFLLLVALAVIILPTSLGAVFIIVGMPGQKLHGPTLLNVIVGGGGLALILPALTGGYWTFFLFRDDYRRKFTSWSSQFSDGALLQKLFGDGRFSDGVDGRFPLRRSVGAFLRKFAFLAAFWTFSFLFGESGSHS